MKKSRRIVPRVNTQAARVSFKFSQSFLFVLCSMRYGYQLVASVSSVPQIRKCVSTDLRVSMNLIVIHMLPCDSFIAHHTA